MPVLQSRLDTASAEFATDRAAMLVFLAPLAELAATVHAAGGERSVTRHRERGKLLARERVDLLLDADAPFLELSALAGAHDPEADQPGARVITGIGPVSGVECLVIANQPTIKGGTLPGGRRQAAARPRGRRAQPAPGGEPRRVRGRGPAQAGRHLRPGRRDLPPAYAALRPGDPDGRAGLRQLHRGWGLRAGHVRVHGAGARGRVGVPRRAALVRMAIKEEADDETLGGAEMHARVSGLADHLAVDERDALRLGRQIVADLGWRKAGPGPSLPADPPRHDREQLLGCAAADPRRAVEVREILARVPDGSRFSEFKPLYGTQLVGGWGSVAGYPVGVLANNGILFSEESNKGAHFIQLANRRDLPLVFLQNITGFMVGTAAERGGIIKDARS